MERPPGLLGQLWDRFGPADSPASGAATDAVMIEAGPEESRAANEVNIYSLVRTDSPSAPVPPPAPTLKQEGSAFGSLEDLERYLDETSGG